MPKKFRVRYRDKTYGFGVTKHYDAMKSVRRVLALYPEGTAEINVFGKWYSIDAKIPLPQSVQDAYETIENYASYGSLMEPKHAMQLLDAIYDEIIHPAMLVE